MHAGREERRIGLLVRKHAEVGYPGKDVGVQRTGIHYRQIELHRHHRGIHLLTTEGKEIGIIFSSITCSEIKFLWINHQSLGDFLGLILHHILIKPIQIKDSCSLFSNTESPDSLGRPDKRHFHKSSILHNLSICFIFNSRQHQCNRSRNNRSRHTRA